MRIFAPKKAALAISLGALYKEEGVCRILEWGQSCFMNSQPKKLTTSSMQTTQHQSLDATRLINFIHEFNQEHPLPSRHTPSTIANTNVPPPPSSHPSNPISKDVDAETLNAVVSLQQQIHDLKRMIEHKQKQNRLHPATKVSQMVDSATNTTFEHSNSPTPSFHLNEFHNSNVIAQPHPLPTATQTHQFDPTPSEFNSVCVSVQTAQFQPGEHYVPLFNHHIEDLNESMPLCPNTSNANDINRDRGNFMNAKNDWEGEAFTSISMRMDRSAVTRQNVDEMSSIHNDATIDVCSNHSFRRGKQLARRVEELENVEQSFILIESTPSHNPSPIHHPPLNSNYFHPHKNNCSMLIHDPSDFNHLENTMDSLTCSLIEASPRQKFLANSTLQSLQIEAVESSSMLDDTHLSLSTLNYLKKFDLLK